MKALTFIEVDVPSFIPSVPEAITTWRFTYPCDYLPADIEAIPSMLSVNHTPAVISLGKDLGTRADLSISFSDHRHIFAGEPFDQGSFWGKWRARHGTRLQGRPLRWIQGLAGQALSQMETRHFVIEATNGPTPQGVYTITAKDILKLADGDRAQAPLPSNGFLVAGIDDNDTAFTLSPAGIGNAEYPASGHLAIGGEEIVSFTRAGDGVTITARGQLGTAPSSHDAGSRAQRVLRYVGEDPAIIIRDLLVNYAGIDVGLIPLDAWLIQTGNYLQQVYSAAIAEPTDVNTLISELIEQAALVVWWDPLARLIKLQVLRAIPTDAATFGEDNTIEGSLAIQEQPTARVSQVFVYYGQRNPLAPIEEERNFRSAVLTLDGDAEAAYNGVPMIRKIHSRWIPFGARSVAVRLGRLVLGRFRDPPRRFSLNLFRHGDENPQLGGGYRLTSWVLQNTDGTPSNAPMQITRLNPLSDRYEVQAEEMLFVNLDPADLVNRVITIDAAIQSINLRELHDAIYPDPNPAATPAESVRFIIEANVIVGSTGAGTPAVVVGNWPAGYPVTLEVRGRIQGKGGDGGRGSSSSGADGLPGQAGGTALYSRFPVNATIFAGGGIWGGGGGGGGMNRQNDDGNLSSWGGGGGAGSTPGNAGQSFATASSATGSAPGNGTMENGGNAGGPIRGFFAPDTFSGAGGNPGQAGGQGAGTGGESNTAGGAAGRAIDGASFVTLNNQAGSNAIKGATVN